MNSFGEENTFNLHILETLLYLNLNFSEVLEQSNFMNVYREILELSEKKLYFKTFIDPNLLNLLQFSDVPIEEKKNI